MFKLRIKAANLSNWQNIFQTADFNSGIRIEINEFGQVGLIIGKKVDGFAVVTGDKALETDKWYTLLVQVGREYGASLKIDNGITSYAREEVEPKCNRLLLGIGYDSTRKFNGQASVVITSALNRKMIPTFPQELLLGQIILTLSLFMLTSLQIRKNKHSFTDCQ